jgi:2-keto-3-deoxy-L-rhamnonate aldolase RhmA
MRSAVALAGIGIAGLAAATLGPSTVSAQGRLNPVIELQEKGLPVFGISHPAIVRFQGRGGGRGGPPGGAPPSAPATPPAPQPEIVLSDVAKETVGYKRADFLFTSAATETFHQYVAELKKAGGSMHTFPFSSKIGIWHTDPAKAQSAIIRQLNAGLMNVSAEEVSSAQEVRDVLKAMRFASHGGTRPDTGLAAAAAYWGLSVDQYKQKADVWPLNKNGELFLSVIIESKEGVAKADEIVGEPGVGQVFVGYGTLGGVYRDDPAGREKAAADILAACKKHKVPCGFPTNNPAEMEQRYNEGWRVFIQQRRDSAAFAAIETGRKLGKRP